MEQALNAQRVEGGFMIHQARVSHSHASIMLSAVSLGRGHKRIGLDPVLDLLGHVMHAASGDVVGTAAAMAAIRGQVTPGEAFGIGAAGSTRRARARRGRALERARRCTRRKGFNLDDRLDGTSSAEECLDRLEVRLLGLCDNVGANGVVGRVEAHEENVLELRVIHRDIKSGERILGLCERVDVGVDGQRRILLDAIEVLASTHARIEGGLLEVRLELGPGLGQCFTVLNEVPVVEMDLGPDVGESQRVEVVPGGEDSGISGLDPRCNAGKPKSPEIHLGGFDKHVPVAAVKHGHLIEEGIRGGGDDGARHGRSEKMCGTQNRGYSTQSRGVARKWGL